MGWSSDWLLLRIQGRSHSELPSWTRRMKNLHLPVDSAETHPEDGWSARGLSGTILLQAEPLMARPRPSSTFHTGAQAPAPRRGECGPRT